MKMPSDNHEDYMREAIRLAADGVARGDGGPFGAVLVKDGRIVGRGWNRVVRNQDPTAHAEIMAIRDAGARLNDFRLNGCVLYTSCEPCPMCLAAAYWARVDRIWYAATAEDAAEVGFDDFHIHEELRAPKELRGLGQEQLLREEALRVFRAWRDSPLRVDY